MYVYLALNRFDVVRGEIMKRFGSHLLVALFTWSVGVSMAALSSRRPTFRGAPEKPVLRQVFEQPSVTSSAWRVLLSFEGRDLRKLDRESAVTLRKAVETLLGGRVDSERAFIFPRLFSKLSDARGQTRYVFIEESPLITVPGRSRIYAHVFDTEGGLLGSSDFNCGHRIFLTEMEVAYAPEVGRELLLVHSRPTINGADIARQFYALVGEKVLLVRLEDSGGRLVRNTYASPGHTIGLTLTGRAAKEWEEALASDDVAETLATMTWLGGAHLNPRKPAPEYAHEKHSEARVADEARSREGVRAALDKLTRSENPWVKGAAEMAAKADNDR